MRDIFGKIKESISITKAGIAELFDIRKPLNALKDEITKPFRRVQKKKQYLTELRSSKKSFLEKLSKTFTQTQYKLSTMEQEIETQRTKQKIAQVRSEINNVPSNHKDQTTGISINAFKQAIGKVETNKTYDMVNIGGASSAVGKYQFLRGLHGKTVKKYMKQQHIVPKKFDKKAYKTICNTYKNNLLLKKYSNDHQYIYHFLTDPTLQENFMTYFIQTYHKDDVKKIYTSYNTKYGEPIVGHGGKTYTLAELYMLVHFQGREGAMTVLKKGTKSLPGSATQHNITVAKYKQTFQNEYNNYA